MAKRLSVALSVEGCGYQEKKKVAQSPKASLRLDLNYQWLPYSLRTRAPRRAEENVSSRIWVTFFHPPSLKFCIRNPTRHCYNSVVSE